MKQKPINLWVGAQGCAPGEHKQWILVHTNDPYQENIRVPVNIFIEGPLSFQLDKDVLAYGPSYMGKYDSATFTITNTSNQRAKLRLSLMRPEFSVKGGMQLELPKLSSREVVVYFTPRSTHNIVDKLVVLNSADNSKLGYVKLTGQGRIAPKMDVKGDNINITLDQGDKYTATYSISNLAGNAYLNWKAEFVPDHTSEETQFTGIEEVFSMDSIRTLSQLPDSQSLEWYCMDVDPESKLIYIYSTYEKEKFCYSYNIGTKERKKLANIPDFRGKYMDVVYQDKKIYMVPNYERDSYLYVYDIGTGIWDIRDMYYEDEPKSIFTDGTYVYTFQRDYRTFFPQVERYDPAKDEWHEFRRLNYYGDFKPQKMAYSGGALYGVLDNGGGKVIVRFNLEDGPWNYIDEIDDFIVWDWDYQGVFQIVPESGVYYFAHENASYYDTEPSLVLYNYKARTYMQDTAYVLDYPINNISYFNVEGAVGFYYIAGDKLQFHPLRRPYYWLELDSYKGEIHGSNTNAITLTINTAGLAPGTYYTNLCMTVDDPENTKILKNIVITVEGNGGVHGARAVQPPVSGNSSLGEGAILYPNPVINKIKLMVGPAHEVGYTIVDQQGRNVQGGFLGKDSPKSIDVNGLKPGVYVIKVETMDQVIVEKFVVK